MISETARHGHKDQRHPNKKYYNRSPGISNRNKTRKQLIKGWNWRVVHAYAIAQFYNSLGPLGSNGLEQIHSTAKSILPWTKIQGVGIKRLAAVASIQQFGILYRRVNNILFQNRNKLYEEYPKEVDMMKKLYAKLCEIRALTKHKSSFDEFGQRILYYPDASIDFLDYVDGVEWENAVDNLTPLNLDDRHLVCQFIDNRIKEFAECDGWYPKTSDLDHLRETMNKDVTMGELQHIAHTYWEHSGDTTDDDEDEDEDEMTEKEKENRKFQKLTGKQKKYSELGFIYICLLYFNCFNCSTCSICCNCFTYSI